MGQEELGGNGTRVAPPQQHVSAQNSSSGEFNPKEVLESLMKQKGVTLEIIKKKLTDEGYDGAEGINSINQIPSIKAFELIERLKKIKK